MVLLCKYSQVDVLSVLLDILVVVVVGILYLVVGDGLGPLAGLTVGEVLQLTREIFTVSPGW